MGQPGSNTTHVVVHMNWWSISLVRLFQWGWNWLGVRGMCGTIDPFVRWQLAYEVHYRTHRAQDRHYIDIFIGRTRSAAASLTGATFGAPTSGVWRTVPARKILSFTAQLRRHAGSFRQQQTHSTDRKVGSRALDGWETFRHLLRHVRTCVPFVRATSSSPRIVMRWYWSSRSQWFPLRSCVC